MIKVTTGGSPTLAGASDFSTAPIASGNTSVATALSGKQDTLVSSTTIKTVNGVSILGSGNLSVTGTASPLTISSPTGLRNGSNTVFTCASAPVIVFRNGMFQSPLADGSNSADYSVSGVTITFASAPLTGDSIFVVA